ncbi:MAG: tRNA dihydrouridine synthase DusB [Proteobacteria bacterium]|nr:MAG: tRNA dihydrouridine synthase DusB [Pseudomonadota bacterium]
MLNIAQYTLTSPLLQAPMAGITDRIYRDLVREHGAGLATSEMITSDLSLIGTKKTQARMPQIDEDSPRSVQIVGTDPAVMAEAAQFYISKGAELIDINFGCPVKKVAGSKHLAGSALLKDEKRVEQIMVRVVEATGSVPVTIKYRCGWNAKTRNATRIAQIAENSGISALALHGRTREDRYKPYAEYETIRQVKQKTNIPVIANGDICDKEQAEFVLDYTQADGLMIGRASFGRPWLFSQLNQSLFGIKPTSDITLQHKREVALRHVTRIHQVYDVKPSDNRSSPTVGRARIVNKVINWYLLNMSVQTDYRPRLLNCRTPGQQLSVFKEALEATTTL